jgi:hypothetical protein
MCVGVYVWVCGHVGMWRRFPHASGADLGDNWISGFSDRHPGGYNAYEEDLQGELEDHMVCRGGK